MYRSKRILAFIPARGGSKGIPQKNIIPLCGKPLIAYTIEAAKMSAYIDDVIVSTDSSQIAEVAQSYGAQIPFMRPVDLAQDTSATIDAVLHGIEMLGRSDKFYDTLILLQPTQPLRTNCHIDQAIELFFTNEEVSLASVSPVNDHPILIRSFNPVGELVPLLACGSTVRRQDMPQYYRVNGCIYINRIDLLSPLTSFNDNCMPFIMDAGSAVDIDDYETLELAHYYMSRRAAQEMMNG